MSLEVLKAEVDEERRLRPMLKLRQPPTRVPMLVHGVPFPAWFEIAVLSKQRTSKANRCGNNLDVVQ